MLIGRSHWINSQWIPLIWCRADWLILCYFGLGFICDWLLFGWFISLNFRFVAVGCSGACCGCGSFRVANDPDWRRNTTIQYEINVSMSSEEKISIQRIDIESAYKYMKFSVVAIAIHRQSDTNTFSISWLCDSVRCMKQDRTVFCLRFRRSRASVCLP